MILGRPFKAGTDHDNCTRSVATPESSPQVTLIVVDLVFLQQLQMLVLKSLLAVMFALILDVRDDIRYLGLAYSESTVAFLPFKTTQPWEIPDESISTIRLSDIVRFRSG
jgi:hypothetical protein